MGLLQMLCIILRGPFRGVSVDPFLADLFGQDSIHRLGTHNREFSGAFREVHDKFHAEAAGNHP
jgi:hypothetical protein